MNQHGSHSYNDPRRSSQPYRPDARQGRYGRVENWRTAEEQKAEQLRQRKQAARREQAMQAQQAAEQRAAQQRKTRIQQQPEPQPWQQGKFGRVENWREVERRRAAQQQAQDQLAHQARQAHEQKLASQQSGQQAQQMPGQAAQQPTRQRAVQQAGQAARKAPQPQQPQESAQHVRRPQQLTQQQRQFAQQQAQQQAQSFQQLQNQAQKQAAAQQAAQAQAQAANQRPAYEQVPKHSSATARYSRDAYASHAERKPKFSNPESRASQSKYDRRPTIDYPAGRRTSASSRKVNLPQVPKKIIAALVAVFAIVIVVSIANPFGQSGIAGSGTDMSTGSAGKTQPSLPTPIMSESSGVTMHSAVAMEDLTEILIHNASYAYANEITTELAEATNTEIIAAHGTGRVASEQPTGDSWMTGEFIRCFRSGNAGPIMSAIDCGGPVGATVYAPVTGEVVLVKQYKLYGEIDDYRIHIQPTGRPDLDVVLIHLTDVTVKAGDKVTAGVTPIAKIRDIFQYLDESLQLKNYTAENDNGNHTHIQVNDATHPEYTALDELKPAAAVQETPTTDR